MSGRDYIDTVRYIVTHDDSWEDITQIAKDETQLSLWVEKIDIFLELNREHSSLQDDSMEYFIIQCASWEEHDQFSSNPKNMEFLNDWKLKRYESTSSNNNHANQLEGLESSIQHKCKTCSEVFASRNELFTHNSVCKNSFECDTCGKSFKFKSYLVQHIKTHSGVKPHQCNICEKRFNRKNNLVRHLRVHSSETPYKCEMCRKTFAHYDSLMSHMRTHNTDKHPYKSEMCEITFARNDNLLLHLRCHSDENPY